MAQTCRCKETHEDQSEILTPLLHFVKDFKAQKTATKLFTYNYAENYENLQSALHEALPSICVPAAFLPFFTAMDVRVDGALEA